ncbi:MAG: hypothetical protein EHM61_12055 [Acidobacteria bacterium]|nr:MAG: hypothetical protein EHM61_12055 [Acidobacteriota bacterium]
MRRESGEGKAGCLLTLLVLIVFGFVCFRTIPVMIDKMDFEDQVERLVSEGGARGWDAESVKTQINDLIRNKQFTAVPEDVKVIGSLGRGGELRVDVKYSRTVDFAGYPYTFNFHTQAKSFVGAL